MTDGRLVSVVQTAAREYPRKPFDPSEAYPELCPDRLASEPNEVYSGVRSAFSMMGLDRARLGTPEWNPLSAVIRPGMTVLIKPNLVRHFHARGGDVEAVVTHASVLRPICDYVFKAAGPEGTVVIADAPLQSCDFGRVLEESGVADLVSYYQRRGLRLEVRDLRLVHAVVDRSFLYGRVLVQREVTGDPRGYTHVDLAGDSLHARREPPPGRFRVTCYDPAGMDANHGGGRHRYIIANSLLEADVVINVPKMKTHHKAGITGGMKNFVGINGHKDCLPHHVQGSAADGGDEYAGRDWRKALDSWIQDEKEARGGALLKKTAAVAHRVLHKIHMRSGPESYWDGSWFGNDTISRTVVDLNRIVTYATIQGRLHSEPQRQVLTIVDGIVGGELDGPLAPTPRRTGILLAGRNAVAVDVAMARLFGYRWDRIPTLRHALDAGSPWPLADFAAPEIEAVSNDPRWHGIAMDRPGESLEFAPHRGWRGRIEL